MAKQPVWSAQDLSPAPERHKKRAETLETLDREHEQEGRPLLACQIYQYSRDIYVFGQGGTFIDTTRTEGGPHEKYVRRGARSLLIYKFALFQAVRMLLIFYRQV